MSKYLRYILISNILLIFLFLLNIKTGYTYYTWEEIFDKNLQDFILRLRIESALTAMIAGAALSLAGLLLQTLFRNPLAGPSVLGISSFSSLCIAMFLFIQQYFLLHIVHFPKIVFDCITLCVSMLGAIFCLMLLFFFKKRNHYLNSLLIIGMMISSFCAGIIYVFESILNKENLQSLTVWHFGSFNHIDFSQIGILLIIVFICLIFIFKNIPQYNTYLLGDLYAQGLGINVKKFVLQNVLLSAALTASITAFCGPIGFIGLAVPHLVKFYFKTSNHQILIPATLFTGINLCLCCHWITSLECFGVKMPINAITSLIGAPFAIWLIFKINNQSHV